MATSTLTNTPIHGHPDLEELRANYERAAETPVARALAGLTLMSGLYIAMSPWIVGFGQSGSLAITMLISGLALALLGAGFSTAYSKTHTVAWVAPLIGAWVVVAPFVVANTAATTSMIVSSAIAGGIAVLLGCGAIGLEAMKPAQQ